MQLFQRLVDRGHSILVIEHNLEVIKCADWVIDLGPEAGDEGGEVVAVGSPEQIAKINESHTGRFLRASSGERRRPRLPFAAARRESPMLTPKSTRRHCARRKIRSASRQTVQASGPRSPEFETAEMPSPFTVHASIILKTSLFAFRATRWWSSPA